MAVAVGVSCWSASAVVGAVSAVAGSLVAVGVTGHRRVVVASFAVAVISIASLRASAAWASISPDATGPFHGWATVAIDPAPVGAATRAVVTVEGERFEVWARARSEAMRVARWTVGDRVEVTGTRTPLPPERIRRVA